MVAMWAAGSLLTLGLCFWDLVDGIAEYVHVSPVYLVLLPLRRCGRQPSGPSDAVLICLNLLKS
jgi:hypothetical protein